MERSDIRENPPGFAALNPGYEDLPELRSVMRRKSGKPDLRCQARR
jgi:hypothetical protein